MPTGPRIRGNNSFGFITDNPLTVGATSFNSAGLVTLPVVTAAHAIITLDPLRQFGEPEIVIVTAHTAAATIATITRGAYGTIARAHPQNTVWTHAPVTEDVIPILTSATRPTDPYRGERIFETDTNRYVGRSTADIWQQDGLFFDPPACRVFHNTTQALTNGGEFTVALNSERFDTDSMHSTGALNERITFNTAGIYILQACIEFTPALDYTVRYVYFRLNGTTALNIAITESADVADMNNSLILSTLYKFSASDYVEIRATQSNVAAAARNIVSNANRSPEVSAVWVGRGN